MPDQQSAHSSASMEINKQGPKSPPPLVTVAMAPSDPLTPSMACELQNLEVISDFKLVLSSPSLPFHMQWYNHPVFTKQDS